MKIKVIPYNTLEYASLDAFPVTGESGKYYLALDTMLLYTWNSVTSLYVSADFRYEGKPAYHGSYLKSGYLEFTMVASPTPIDWHNGDYIRYDRTGRIYKLYGIPQIERQASTNHSGESFAYRNVQLYDNTKELSLVPFRDLIPGSGEYYFSSKQDVAFTGTVANVVERLNANLEAFFGEDVWNVRIADNIPESYEVSVAKDFSVSGMCIDALNAIYETWNELGWAYAVENGVNTIIIGYPNIAPATSGNRTNVFSYDNGLTALKRNNGGMDNFCTRMHVYGTERNLINRYYNGKDIYNAASVFIQNLMIPIELWGTTDSKPDARKAYIEDADKIALYGLITKDVYFDGTDGRPEIYPSIEQQTIEILKAAKTSLGKTTAGAPDYYPQTEDDTIRVDQIKAAVQMPLDDGTPTNSGEKYIDTYEASINSTIVNAESVTNRLLNQVQLFEYTFVDTGVVDVRWNGALKCVLDQALGEGDYLALKLCVYKDGIYRDTLVSSADFVVESDVTNGQIFNLDTLLSVGTKTNQVTGRFVVTLQYSVILANADSRAGDNTRIITITKEGDVVASANMREALVANFKIKSHQIGFDIAKMQSSGGATLAVRSGMCAGREFSIIKAIYNSDNDDWTLTCQRSQDTSTQTYYPNASFPIAVDDEFVILGITMPEEYILAQAHRLYTLGQELFDKVSVFRPTFEPTIDSKKVLENITEHPSDAQYKLIEGKYMRLYDENLIDGNHNTDVLISEITINEGEAEIATYHVVLSDKATVTGGLSRTVSKLSTEVEKIQEAQRSQVRSQEQGSPSGTQTIPDGGSNVNPIYIKDGIPRIIDGLEVENDVIAHRNVEAMGGVAAHGMATLQRGGGGGMGTVTGINVNGTLYEPSQGLITLPDYPTAASLISDGLASQSWVNSNFAGIGYEARVQAIEALIPSQATSLNQLADKAFVNSSIATATAEYQGNYNSVSDLSLSTSASRSDIATALGTAISGADNNDYCFVEIPTSDSTPTQIARIERYKFNGTSWSYEYTLNNSGFTAAQWATINSGLVSTGGNTITTLGTIGTGVWHGSAIADDYIASASAWNAKYDKPSGGIPKTDLASGVQTSLGLADTALQSHQTIYNLIIKKNGTQVGSTYNPATAAQTIDITDVASANALSGVSTRVGTLEGYFSDGLLKKANHYSPASDSSADYSASATGATASWGIDVVKAVQIQRDAKGHIIGVTVTSGKIPAKPTYAFSDLTSHPTTLSDYGITDGVNGLQKSGSGYLSDVDFVEGNDHSLAFTFTSFAKAQIGHTGGSGTTTYKVRVKADGAWSDYLALQQAGASAWGIVTDQAQTFGGDKTFNDNIQSMKGVAARGMATLQRSGGGGSGTLTQIQINGTPLTDVSGVVNIPLASNSVNGAMSSADKSKLDNIEAYANNYVLPAATSGALGGIRLGYSASGKNYPVQLDGNNKAYVNVPWENTTYSNGTGLDLSSGVFSINSTYQGYISNGNTAFGYFSSGVLPASHGGTGKDNLTDAGSAIINALGEGASPATRNDYIVAQYAGGGTTTTTYHRRKLSNIFAALNSSDITTALGYTPFNNASFTQANIKSTLGISDWALAASKPSYAFSEITGTVTNAQLAGSIANSKLASAGKFTIGSTAIELGTTYTAANFRGYLGLGGAATYGATSSVTDGGTSLVTSGGVYSYVNALLTAAMKIEGETTTAISDGSTTNPVTIGGQSVNAYKGMVVFYGSKEFVWVGTNWKELGDESSFALKTTTVSGTGYLTGGGALSSNQTIDIASSVKTKIDNGATAYGWGNHADAGYALAANLGTASTHAHGDYVTGISWDSTSNKLAWSKGGTAQTTITINYSAYAGTSNGFTPEVLSDFDNGTKWRFFRSSGSADSHKPSTRVSWFNGFTLASNNSDSYKQQLAIGLDDPHIYFRNMNSGTWGDWINLIDSTNIGSQSVSYATNAALLDGYHASQFFIRDTHRYGLENLCTGVLNGGQTTSVVDGKVITSGSGTDTYFFITTSEPVVAGQIYSFGFYVEGWEGSGTWSFRMSNNADCATVKITGNGWYWGTGIAIPDGGSSTSTILIDDLNSPAKVLTFSQFVLVKGDAFPYYTPPISQMHVAIADNATKLSTARTIWGQSFDGSANISGALTDATAITHYNNGAGYWMGLASVGTGGTGLSILAYGNNPINFYTNNQKRAIIDGSGNVGIGTASPSYKLHVAGDIYANGNIVANGGVAARGMATLQGGAGTGNPVTQINVGSTAYTPSSGVVSLPAYPTWSTLSGKPSNVSAFTNDSGYIDSSALAVTFTTTTLTSSSTSVYLNNTVQRDTLQKVTISSANNNQQFNIHLRGSGSYYGYHRQVYIHNQSGKDIYIQLTGVAYISMGAYVSVNPNTGAQLVNYNPISMDDDYNYMYLLDIIQADSSEYPIVKITHLDTWAD